MKFIHYFSFLDFFKVPLHLVFSRKFYRSTSLGTFLSISLIAFLCYQFLQSDFFKKEGPFVVRQSKETTHGQAINFDKDSLVIAVLADGTGKRLMDPSLISIVSIYSHIKKNLLTGEIETISEDLREWKPCQKEDAPFDESYFQKIPMEKAYCLKNKTFILEGIPVENELSMFATHLLPCNNATVGNICKSIEEINIFFNSNVYFFQIGVRSAAVDVFDYEDPFKFNYGGDPMTVDPSLVKLMYNYFHPFELVTDSGVFTASEHKQTEFRYSKTTYDFKTRNSEILQLPMASVFFFAADKIETISRRYEKLPDTLAKIVGLLSSIKFLLFFVINPIIELETMKKLLGKIFY